MNLVPLLRTALIEETDYIEYMCEKPGWSLLGDYKMPEQFDGDMVAIVYGRDGHISRV